jgi:hypothetical protein
MAQTGYTPILIYSSTTASQSPSASNLTNSTLGSELAINITDGKLFYKDNGGSVQVIGWKTVPTTAGGTGLTSYTAGDLIYYATGTTLSKLGIGTNGQILKSTGSAPAWETVSNLAVTSISFGTTGLTPSTATQGAVTVAGTLVAANGGTGQSSYTIGDILYASGTTTLSKLADVATGNALISGGVGVAPSWGKIALTTHISGVLPVANGGTNASSASITAFNNITGYTASGATGTTSTNLVFSTSPTITTPSVTGDATLSTGNVVIGTGGKGLTTGSAVDLGFGTNNATTAMLLDGTYNNFIVGATTQPNAGVRAKFAVSYSLGDYTVSLLNSNSSPYGIYLKHTTDVNGTGNPFYVGLGAANTRFAVRSNGGIENYSANNVNLSDRREKTNFSPAKSYLDVICAIPVQTFNYVDQNMEQDPGLTLGVVAQDVQSVAPEFVMESNWGTNETPRMRLSIYQTDLQYALMKCIQELKAQNDVLMARLDKAGL